MFGTSVYLAQWSLQAQTLPWGNSLTALPAGYITVILPSASGK